jgi:excisionase family DNA binding protein
MTTIEAAALLRCCPSSVRKLCDQKRLKCIRHSERGKRLILAESVEAYIASLTDDVETFTPATVAFDDVEKRMKERTQRLRRVK